MDGSGPPPRLVPGTIALLLSGLVPGVGYAQDVKLITQCAAPQLAAAATLPPAGSDDPALASASAPLTTVICNLWATDAVTFKTVKASIKGQADRLDVQYDPRNQTLAVMFLIQLMDPARRSVMTPMLDTVVKIAEPRDAKHRYAAYSIANDLNLVADFSASKADFDKQVRAVKGVALPTQLYKGAIEAIAKLAKEKADRKALVILGDGNSDDTSYDHDPVVKAARDAGVIIHALGFAAEASDQPKFQYIRRLAEETGGFRREVRVGSSQKYTINNQFVAEALENGGTATMTCGSRRGRRRSASPPISTTGAPRAPSSASRCRRRRRRGEHPRPTRSSRSEPAAPAAWYQQAVCLGPREQDGRADQRRGTGVGHDRTVARRHQQHKCTQGPAGRRGRRGGGGDHIVYGWLEMLDGNASRYPLQTTNVRIGRHRDNDICLQNEFDLAAARAAAFQCGQAALRHHGPGRRQRCHRQQGQAAIARVERWRPGGARRGPIALPRQHGGRGCRACCSGSWLRCR